MGEPIPAAGPQVATSKKHHHLPLILAVALAAIAGFLGWKYLTSWRYDISTDDAYIRADIVAIAPEVSGYILEASVQDNQPVKAGDLLARIDPKPYDDALALARAELEAAEAGVAEIKAELDVQPSLVAEARATVAKAEAALTLANENLQRASALAGSGAASVQTRQTAASAATQAEAQLTLARAALQAAGQRTTTLQAQQALAVSKVREAKASLAAAQFRRARTEIRAPVSGVIGNRQLRKGLYVQPGSQLLSIVPLQDAYVIANYKETQIASIRPGQRVQLAVDAYPDLPATGAVESISPAAGQEFALLPPNNATGNFTKIVQRVPVKIRIDPQFLESGRLLPGMSVTADILTRNDAGAGERPGS